MELFGVSVDFNKPLDLCMNHPVFTLTLVYGLLSGDAVALWEHGFTGNWFGAACVFLLFLLGLGIAIPVSLFDGNRRIRDCLEYPTGEEKPVLDAFASGRIGSLPAWPHDGCIARLYQCGFLCKLPHALPGEMESFGMTERGKRILRKHYRVEL
jgi:hypothetical protein